MRLDHANWYEVESYIRKCPGIFLPTGSIEQHGPMGLIGTDSFCAQDIADTAAEKLDILSAPAVCYSPSPFNMSFPGTISVSIESFIEVVAEIALSLKKHGFKLIYIVNAHGANLEPLFSIKKKIKGISFHVRSWWDFEEVNLLRQKFYGEWEGMHATPSEIAITQVNHRKITSNIASIKPRKLTLEYIAAHSGDRHGTPNEHRASFPDGRVGSHSALATPEKGKLILETAAKAISRDFLKKIELLKNNIV